MKFGIHAGLWMENWTDDPSFVFDKVAHMGFDGVEVSLLGIGLDTAEKIRKNAENYGLEITCSTGLGVGQNPSSAHASERQLATDTLKHAVEVTATLGSKLLAGVVASPWGVFDPLRIPERIKYSAQTLGGLQSHLQKYNVRLGIEALNRFESDLTCTTAYAVQIAEKSGADNVGVLLDTFHMNMEEKYPTHAIQQAGKKLFHYHISAHDRGVPQQGRYDFNADAHALKQIGYDNWVVAEMFVQSGLPTSRDLNIWRPIETNVDVSARRAFNFMQQVYG